MENVRRSPRNHQGPSKSRSLHIKAANINWESDDSALLGHLISAMESNRRWRHGVFSGRPTSGSGSLHTKADKVIYYDEIAQALFSRHPHFRSSYRKKPAAFARAIKDKLDTFPARCAVEARFGTVNGRMPLVLELHYLAIRARRHGHTSARCIREGIGWNIFLCGLQRFH
ncbi:hypothetical protein BS47DRAFT_467160 [Hydnum rufescens UP504]|uniref:Uncharacterized protein n=1 Tax=Hydnum rufescens UP504 TaxID=1448309 RepID=A0A9P6DWN0_9AGAM|nr:hypothetical protein BS47DRAFT_467160 [Hydnum rufescens UP504]